MIPLRGDTSGTQAFDMGMATAPVTRGRVYDGRTRRTSLTPMAPAVGPGFTEVPLPTGTPYTLPTAAPVQAGPTKPGSGATKGIMIPMRKVPGEAMDPAQTPVGELPENPLLPPVDENPVSTPGLPPQPTTQQAAAQPSARTLELLSRRGRVAQSPRMYPYPA
jgi:hypothetical protein